MNLKQSLELIFVSTAIAITVTLSQSTGHAQVRVSGSTEGSIFNTGTTTLGGLTFQGNAFDGTANPVLVLAQGNNLGTLTVNESTIGETSGTFGLQVLFSLPTGFSTNPVVLPGEVFGFYTDAFNFALIDFPNDPVPVTFSGAYGTGVFALTLNDVCLDDGVQCSISPPTPIAPPSLTKLGRPTRVLNALAFNSTPRGDGDVKFVKAKASLPMFAHTQNPVVLEISATITLTQFSPANEGQCKKEGWRTFVNPSYKNQGDCVSAFARAAAGGN